MADKVKGITLEIGGDTVGLKKALKDINKEVNSTSKELKQVERLLKLDPKNTELLAQKQSLLSKNVDTTKDKLEKLKKTQIDTDNSIKNGVDVDQEQYRLLQREIVQTEQDLKKLTKETSNFTKVGDNLKSVGGKMTDIGKKNMMVSAALTGIGIESIKMASDFDNAIAKVSTISDDSEVPIAKLKDSILELSNQTGISSDEIANNVYDAISAGQKTGDAVNFVSNSTKLAKAGFAEAGQSLDVLTTILNAYGKSSSEVNSVSDMLIQTQNKGKVTVGQLASTMGKIIPTANASNVGLEQLCAGYAIMTSKGIAATETTTYMNGMLNELSKSGTTASDTIKKETGKSFQELMKSGKSLGDILTILNDSAKDNGKSLGDMFGSAEAGKAALTLLSGGAEGFNNSVKDMLNSTGATGNALEKMETPSQKAKKAINELKNTGIELGENILQSLMPALESLAKTIHSFSQWFSNLDGWQQKIIIAIGAIIAIIPPLLILIGSMITAVGTITGAMAGLNLAFLACPVTWIIAGIVALVATFVILWNKCEAFRNFWINLWENIKTACSIAWSAISEFFINAWNGIVAIWDGAVGYFKFIWENIKLVFSVVKNILTGNFGDAWNGIKKIWDNVKAYFATIWNNIKKAFKIDEMLNIGKNLLMGLWNGINDKVQWLKDKVVGVVNKIKSWFTGKKGFDEHSPSKWAEQVGVYIDEGLANGIDDGTNEVADSTDDLIKKIKNQISNGIKDGETSILNEVEKGGKNLLDSERKYITESIRLRDSKEEKDKAYLDSLKDIASDERKIYDNNIKEINAYKKELVSAYKEIVTNITDSVDELEKAQGDFSDKLKGYGTLYEEYDKFAGWQFDEKTGTVTQKTEKAFKLSDISEQTDQLKEYANNLMLLRDAKNVPREFFNMIRDMSVDEGLNFTDLLINADDDTFSEYIEQWKEKNNYSDSISKILYADEFDDLRNEINTSLDSFNEDFNTKGKENADAWGAAFIEQFNTVMTEVKIKITDTLSNLMPSDETMLNIVKYGSLGRSLSTTNNDNRSTSITINNGSNVSSAYEQRREIDKLFDKMAVQGVL